MSKKSGCKSVDNNWDGIIVYSVVQVGSGSASVIITADFETLGVDNLEFEVDVGTWDCRHGQHKFKWIS
jgi:hypothetical protein